MPPAAQHGQKEWGLKREAVSSCPEFPPSPPHPPAPPLTTPVLLVKAPSLGDKFTEG